MDTHPSGIPHIDVAQAYSLRADDKIVLIDVREPLEWQQTGLPEGSQGIALQNPALLDEVLAAVGNDKDRPIAFTCAVGGRSLQAAILAHNNGFTQVYNVDGGFGAWHAAGLPTQPAGD